ncbi:MAG: hypothetical protein E7159_00150 [Firmicutes bacterium]|jgi:hypothetical protein|nr:hypothetical protein [Bacillota bacterium]
MEEEFLIKTKNNLLISQKDKETLKYYGIDVDNYKTLNELLYAIDNILDNEDLDSDEEEELDYIANTLQERNYYLNFNK